MWNLIGIKNRKTTLKYEKYNERNNLDLFSFINLGDTQVAITFKPRRVPDNALSHSGAAFRFLSKNKDASRSDMELAKRALNVFTSRALQNIYGRRWHKSEELRFACISYPEDMDREGLGRVPLHFHMIFGFLIEQVESVEYVKECFREAWNRISFRLYGESSELYVEAVNCEVSYRRYCIKNLSTDDLTMEPMIVTSKNGLPHREVF